MLYEESFKYSMSPAVWSTADDLSILDDLLMFNVAVVNLEGMCSYYALLDVAGQSHRQRHSGHPYVTSRASWNRALLGTDYIGLSKEVLYRRGWIISHDKGPRLGSLIVDVCGVVFTEPQEEVSLMYRMTSWIRSKDPFNSEGGMEENVKGGPPEEKEQKREEVEKKENETVQKPLEERISSLEKELEAAFAEISSRKEVESKFLAENEELRAENQHLSKINGTLQIDKRIEMENLASKNDDLERTNEHLKQELCNKKVVLEQYKNKLMEKDKSNIKLTQKLEKVRHNKRKLEKFVEKKMEVIEQISEQRLELQKSLDEARINDLIRNGRYKCLLQELETLKKENLNKLSDFEQQNIQLREELENFKSEKNDGQKADVQKDVRDNKSEEKVVEAEDQDPNGRKAEKEENAGASGVGQVLGWLLASKGALPDTNNRQEEQKLEKETSRDEEEEEKQKEEKIAKTTRKPIVFDLEPEKPKSIVSSPSKVKRLEPPPQGTVASTGTWLST
ncbi:calponin homology domain-containing protein DDB_G0272472-like [Palaemon carinicauda]|uniref:calponin homology domain-containing protein DDB_G0272472-like n=1 Tax=Palaemon carinicauda TaxID=392227 RepID=UPI0035B59F82